MSIEDFFQSQPPNRPRHFMDVAKQLLSPEKEQEDTRPWKWEEKMSRNDWLEIKKRFKEGYVDKIWDVQDTQIIHNAKGIRDEGSFDSLEILYMYIAHLRGTYKEAIPYVVQIRLMNGSEPIYPEEKLFEFLETRLRELKESNNFKEYFFVACLMRIMVADKVELTKDLKIIITDKPQVSLEVEIPKRPTRLKK